MKSHFTHFLKIAGKPLFRDFICNVVSGWLTSNQQHCSRFLGLRRISASPCTCYSRSLKRVSLRWYIFEDNRPQKVMKTWPKNKIFFILYVYHRDWSWRPWGVCGMQSRTLQIRKTVKKSTKIHENRYNRNPYTNDHFDASTSEKKLRMVLFGTSQLRNFSTLFDNF